MSCNNSDETIFNLSVAVNLVQKDIEELKRCGVYKLDAMSKQRLLQVENTQIDLYKKLTDFEIRLKKLENN